MIKPDFFDDPELAELSMAARMFFIGLWTQADRAGRLVDDPKRLKARIFPYDDVNVEALIEELHGKDMIRRYLAVEKHGFIWIRTFEKHQRPHPKEPQSLIPKWTAQAVKRNGETRKNTEGTPESGSLDSGLLILECGTPPAIVPRHTRTGSGALAGALPRDHIRHAICGRVCLHETQFQQFVLKLGGDGAPVRVGEWVRTVLEHWDAPPLINQPIQGNNFQWWDARWVEWQGRPQSAQAAKTLQPRQDWSCQHVPACAPGTSPFRCQQRTDLEKAKASA